MGIAARPTGDAKGAYSPNVYDHTPPPSTARPSTTSPLVRALLPQEAILGVFEWVFLGIFTVEMLAKILAYGFAGHKNAYLRDAWCQLDFVVVTLAWLPKFVPEMGNTNAFRAIRALRPLRALKRVPGMPVLVQWILSVLPKMGNVLMLCGFVFLIFGIVGMELFQGVLHHRCALTGSRAAALLPADASEGGGGLGGGLDGGLGGGLGGGGGAAEDGAHALDTGWDTGLACNPSAVSLQQQLSGTGPPSVGTCPVGSVCTFFADNPEHGLNSFDSVAMACLILIQAVTFDDWATPMYSLMLAFSPFAWVYFILIVTVG